MVAIEKQRNLRSKEVVADNRFADKSDSEQSGHARTAACGFKDGGDDNRRSRYKKMKFLQPIV